MAEYAANFVYKPDHVHSTPDVIFCIPALKLIGIPQSLLNAARQDQNRSIDEELVYFKKLVDDPTSDFLLNQG